MKKKRDLLVYLEDIVESAEMIEAYIENISEVEFNDLVEKQDATIRRIQIIGEAAKHIPSWFRLKWNYIPWKDIAGMRDIIVHEYFGITIGMVWKTATEDIPTLKVQVQEIIEQIDDNF